MLTQRPHNVPAITTIIPTYRRPEVLTRAVRSVLNQSYSDLQVCVYDNASGDETADVVADLVRQDSRVKYHRHAENMGGIKNFEYGLAQVNTPFFSFLSDDDMVLPDFYANALDGFRKYPEAMFSSTQTNAVDAEGRVTAVPGNGLGAGLHRPPDALLAVLAHNPPNWAGVLFRLDTKPWMGVFHTTFSDAAVVCLLAARFPFVHCWNVGALSGYHPNSFSGSSGMRSSYWHLVYDEIERHLTDEELLDGDTREKVRLMLKVRAGSIIRSMGMAAILRRDFAEAHQAATTLRNHYQYLPAAFAIERTTTLCRHLPMAHWFLCYAYALRAKRQLARTRESVGDREFEDLVRMR